MTAPGRSARISAKCRRWIATSRRDWKTLGGHAASFPLFRNATGKRARLNVVGAFSLIEVVLALGVVSFAIVGIMGLFPVALRTGQESQRETRATHLAQQIYADLKVGPATNTFLSTTPGNFQTINLANPSSRTNSIYFDSSGTPLGTSASPESEFAVDVIIDPNTPTAGLARVQVNVMAPAAAPPANRSTNTFVTLMRQN